MIAVPEAVRHRFQNPRRAEVRREAATRAAGMLRARRGWDAAALHELLGILQTDWYDGKLLRNRFAPGLVGQHEKWLLESIDAVSRWLGAIADAMTQGIDDAAAGRLLSEYWALEVKAPYVFPTAILSVVDPERFVVFTKPTLRALHALAPGFPPRRAQDAALYLRICEVLRALCDENGWPLCLVDSALHVPSEPAAVSAHRFEGFTAATVEFLRQLPSHTGDPPWHVQRKDIYRTALRDPTLALVAEIGSQYIAALDPEVAEPDRPTSVLKKNDYGGDSYYAHYWFAFFDPAAARKTQSAQLYAIFDGTADEIRYGVGVGHYGRAYHDRLLAALREDPGRAAARIDELPTDLEVQLSFKDSPDVSRPVGELAAALRAGGLEELLGPNKLESIRIQRRIGSLEHLAIAGRDLVAEIGATFVAVWPLFHAARTGRFEVGDPGAIDAPGPSAAEDSSPLEEDVPDSLADLSTMTSVGEAKLEEIEEALLARGQIILTGPPGTSKTFIAHEFARYFARAEADVRPGGSVHVLYLHAGWAYEDFFEGSTSSAR